MQNSKYCPIVSIIITCYNYEKYVGLAIESALAQTYHPIEVIVVDDGSRDSSSNVIKSYKDVVKSIFQTNAGQSAAINNAFAVSQGEIVCLLDADDTFVAEKVSRVVDIFNSYPEVDWCFHPLKYVDNHDNFIAIYPPPPDTADVISFKEELIKRARKPRWGSPTSGLSFRRSLMEKIVPLPKDLVQASDSYLRILALYYSQGYFLDESLAVLRVHGSNNRYAVNSSIILAEAVWTRRAAPDLWRLSNKAFSLGLSEFWKEKVRTQQSKLLIQEYRAMTPPLEWLDIYIRAFYYRFLKNN